MSEKPLTDKVLGAARVTTPRIGAPSVTHRLDHVALADALAGCILPTAEDADLRQERFAEYARI